MTTRSFGAFGYAGSVLHPQIAQSLDQTEETYSELSFDAKASNSVYGEASSVQPNAASAIALIKF